MDDDRAKWHAAYDRFAALGGELENRASEIYSQTIMDEYTLAQKATGLVRAVELALEEQNDKAAKAHQADIVKDYEDALAGADIMATLEGTKCAE